MLCVMWGLYFLSVARGLGKPSYSELAIIFGVSRAGIVNAIVGEWEGILLAASTADCSLA